MSDLYATTSSDPEPKKSKGIEEEALKNYKLGTDSYNRQFDRERDDLRFQSPEYQWDEDAKQARNAQAVNGVPVPARPCLSISKIDQPIQLVMNQMTSAKLGVNIHPLSADASDETAEVFQGLYRKIERDSRADQARGWAFDRAIKAGRGVYRVNTEYDDDGGDDFDQRITIERILYQDAVVFDPAATKPDFSDGEWAFVCEWMPIAKFKRLYPKAKASEWNAMDFEQAEVITPDWVKFDGDQRGILVSEYFCKKHDTETVKSPDGKQSRTRDVVTVMYYKLCPGENGLEVLEEQEWNGKYIPLIPVIGKELQPFDNDRRWVGIIRGAKDAQKLYNYAATNAIEIAALEPKAPWLGAEGQFEGHEAEFQQSNTRNMPFLQYHPMSLDGNQLPPPQRVQVDVSRLGPSMMLLEKADDFIQATTYTPDPALGNLNSRDRSGKAIQALQGQSEAATSNYLQSMANVSMLYEARVVLDLIPKIYDRAGRITQVLKENGESELVMLNKPFVKNAEGRPMPAPEQPARGPLGLVGAVSTTLAPQGPLGAQTAPQGPPPKTYDLSQGSYGVDVTIGKSYPTRLQQGRDQIGQLLQADPALMPLIGDIYFKFQDIPEAELISKRMKRVLEQTHPGIDDEEGQEPTADQLKAKLQGAEMQMKQMQDQLGQASKAIETDQAKQGAQMRKAEIDAQVELKKAELEYMKSKEDNETKIRVAEIQAGAKIDTEQLAAVISLVLDKSKAAQDSFNRRHEADLNQEAHAHELGMAAVSGVGDPGEAAQMGGEE